MLRKLLIASAVLAATSSIAFAHNYKGDYKGEAAPAPCPSYSFAAGPYIGLSVGPRTNYSNIAAVYKGFEGTLSGGYAMMMNPVFYLGGEIFVADSANIKDFKGPQQYYVNPAFTHDGVRTSWSYGISIIPGYMITDHVLAYVRAGAVRTRFSDANANATAWQLGVGAQTNVYQNWDVRGEYVYSGYGSVNFIGKPASDQFNLGVVYKFV